MIEDIVMPTSRLALVIANVILVLSIFIKNKKISKLNIIASVLYLIFNVTFLPTIIYGLDLDIGWDQLYASSLIVLADIFLIISIIINAVRVNKRKPVVRKKTKTNNPIPYVVCLSILYSTCFIVPVAAFFTLLSQEKHIISETRLVLEYNYQGGIVISEDSIVTVADNGCQTISDSNLLKNIPSTQLELSRYSVEVKNDDIEISSYDDESLANIDMETIEKIVADSAKRAADKKEPDSRIEIHITKLGNSEYYYVEVIEWPKATDRSGSVRGEFVYRDTSYHCDVHGIGDLERATLLD